MTNLPQYPESMSYDGLAYKNLVQFFIEEKYVISQVLTLFGNREFGKDWVIEKLNEHRGNTGIEFFVQSKTTNEIEKDGYISFQFETKNINYLAAKTVPVFIHLVQREQNIGYLMDFQEWYNANFSPKWDSEQGVATVKIPIDQKLSDDLVNEIVKKVSDENYRARIRKAADLFNARNPDFRASAPEFFENNVFTIMEPKHDHANFEITVNEIGNEAIRKVLEEGYSATFPLLEDNSPSPFESVFIPTGETIVTMIPHIPQETISFDITLFDDKENITEQYEDVTFRIVRPGSKEREMWGQSKGVPIIFSLTTHHNETRPDISKARFGFFCSEPNNYGGIKAYIEFHDKWTTSTRIILRYTKNKNMAAEFNITNLPPINENIRRFINAAYNLDQNHDIHIPAPAETEINDELLCYTELANEIKSNGKSHWAVITKPIVYKVNIGSARKIVEHFKLNQYIVLGEQNASSIQLGIRGVTIDLGFLRTILHVTKIPNLIDIEKQLSDHIDDDDMMITIEVEIDEEKSFTVQVAGVNE